MDMDVLRTVAVLTLVIVGFAGLLWGTYRIEGDGDPIGQMAKLFGTCMRKKRSLMPDIEVTVNPSGTLLLDSLTGRQNSRDRKALIEALVVMAYVIPHGPNDNRPAPAFIQDAAAAAQLVSSLKMGLVRRFPVNRQVVADLAIEREGHEVILRFVAVDVGRKFRRLGRLPRVSILAIPASSR